jgi:hypothetical protein
VTALVVPFRDARRFQVVLEDAVQLLGDGEEEIIRFLTGIGDEPAQLVGELG